MVVQAVNALACDLSPLAALVHDIRSLMSNIQDCRVVYVPRQTNIIAHRLASFSYEDNVTRDCCIPHGRIGLASKVFDQLQEGLRHAAAILTTWLGRNNLSIRASWES
ncbi:hypothetical protein ACLB2K_028097 [Fragaria x ananassa]